VTKAGNTKNCRLLSTQKQQRSATTLAAANNAPTETIEGTAIIVIVHAIMNKSKRPPMRPPMPPRKPHSRPHSRGPEGAEGRPPPAGNAVWLFGSHAVLAGLANPARRCHRLLATAQESAAFGPPAAARGVAIEVVERRDIDRLLPGGAVHQGVALLAAPPPEPDLGDVLAGVGPRAVVVVLDQATDPRNVGACLRAAAAFEAAAVVIQRRHGPPDSGVLAKAASGALEIVPLVRVTNLARALDEIKEAGFWCVGLDGAATTVIAEADLSGRVALVLGAEGHGLRRLTREHCDHLVRIPISGRVESLNVATAAAVALYEVARRMP